MESWLSKLEYAVSIIIANLINHQIIPEIQTNDYLRLLHFILIQYSRTKKRESEVNEQLDLLMSKTVERIPSAKPYQKERKIPITEIISIANEALPLLNYLNFQLIINETCMPFICSDNPVVLYNQLMEVKKSFSPGDSWASKGLQAFYPISPKHLLFWSDPSVYKSGGRKTREIVATKNETDILQINGLQYLNCNAQLFFNRAFKKDHLDQIANSYYQIKFSAKPIVRQFGSYTFVTGENKKINLKLSFVKFNKYGKEFELGGRLVNLRHPSFHEIRKKIRD